MAISPGCFCFRSRLRGLGAFVAVCLLAGCGTLTTPARPEPGLWAADAKSCSRWFEALDASTDSAGVRDGGAYRIPGFAYLRTDRFLASFRDEVADKPDNADSPDKPEAFSAWVGRLKQLDQSAREAELRNLPLQFLPLAGVADKADVAATTRRCADLLAGTLGILRAERALLVKRAQVPDDYADWRRTVGLYPLTRIPFLKGV